MILNITVAACVCLALVSLHYLWEETKKDIADSINADIRKDFHRTKSSIAQANWDDLETIVAGFKERWKPYVGYGQLNHYIQELNREITNKELYTDGARTGRALI